MSDDIWKLTLGCTRDEADRIVEGGVELTDVGPAPVLVTSEPDAGFPERWQLDAYFEGKPSRALLRRVAALVPSARVKDPRARPLPDQDWVGLSQSGFDPLIAGRFHVRTPDHPARPGLIDLVVPAGLAFGTGQHATTAGCLAVLDLLKARGAVFRNILDLGTGTGLLAFAAARLWPGAAVTASDIDPVAIAVAAENAALNRFGGLRLVVADGVLDRRIVAHAPYDLVIANVLAAPLIDMAASVGAAVAGGGTLILAGLLDTQAVAVAQAYRRSGMRLASSTGGEWPVLRMVARTASRR